MTLKSFDQLQFHPISERLVQILCDKTQIANPLFFRVIVAYYWCKVAAIMRTTITTHDRGDIPVNMYALAVSPSGTGKGVSTGMMERDVLKLFKKRFKEETFPIMAEQHLPKIALKRATRKGTDPDDELLKVTKDFESMGELQFDFCDASTPAVKQLRQKLLMAHAGAVNLEIDEIGTVLLSTQEVFPTFLELFDEGYTKNKLLKSTSDSKRLEEMDGGTPTNLLMFGEPLRLMDGGKTEDELYSLLDTGYARRCFFGYNRSADKKVDMTPEQLFESRIRQDNVSFIEQLADHMESLADIVNANRKLAISRETSLLLTEYELMLGRQASQLPRYDEMKKKEMAHRHFKTLKLAGAYAFIDGSPEVTEEHLYYAIKLAEESGQAFQQLLTRDRAHVKLAKYMAEVGREVTHADLAEDLPFYKGSMSQRQDMINLAVAWGYTNNIIIKKSFNDGIEFLRGESLKATDTSRMIVAWSDDITEGYRPEYAPFEQLHKLTQAPGLHWVNHHLVNGYRNEENAIPGFNLLVLDVDCGCNISTAKELLRGTKFMLYTTKRHTDAEHRYRILLPMNFELKLDAKDFREFYKAIEAWMPFKIDEQCALRSKKWLTHPGHFEYCDGELFDVLPFIPKTSKNEQRKRTLDSQQSMDNLERWMINHIGDGNRNNMLHRYARILVDAGFGFDAVKEKVFALNGKIPDKLDETEIMNTIMTTVGRTLVKASTP